MEKVFSYGTLQLDHLQQSLFGRKVTAQPDILTGYVKKTLKISDPEVVAKSGINHHPILVYTGLESDKVAGSVLMLTEQELAITDQYEVKDYQRKKVDCETYKSVWLYCD